MVWSAVGSRTAEEQEQNSQKLYTFRFIDRCNNRILEYLIVASLEFSAAARCYVASSMRGDRVIRVTFDRAQGHPSARR